MRKPIILCCVVIFTVVFIGGFDGEYIAVAQAQAEPALQADDLAKEINKELRSAENNMFSGKNEVADKQLEDISLKLTALKELDAEHKNIKTLESKYDRTKKTIDKKLGRTTKVSSGEIKGLAEKPVVKEVDPNQEIRGLDEKPEVKEVDPNQEIRGLAEKPEVKEVDPNQEIRGLAEKPEVKEVDPNQEIKGLAEKPEVQEMASEAPTAEMSTADRRNAKRARGLPQPGNPAVQADIDVIIELYNAYHTKFKEITGKNIAYWTVGDGLEQSEEALATIEQAESDFDAISSDVGRLAEKYALSGDIYNNIKKELGTNPQGDPGNKLEALILAGTRIAETRVATSDHLASSANRSINAWADQMTDEQLATLTRAKKLLVVAVLIDPGNETAINLLGEMDEKIVQFSDKMKETIDKNVWQENMSGFSGPGDITTLADSAKAYFETEPNWGGRENNKITVVALAITGSWSVAERDAFGRVIRWRLPVNLAITDDNLKSRNITRVYGLSVLARQGSPDDAPKQPPWNDFWVGDSYMMRLNKLSK